MLNKKIGAIALAAMMAMTSIGCAKEATTVTETETKEVVQEVKLEEVEKMNKDQDVVNLLLIGEDRYPEEEKLEDNVYSDAVMVVSIQRTEGKMIVTSLMAETVVDIPGMGSDRMKEAYEQEGAEKLVETVEANFDIEIDGYLQTEFIDFIDIADAVGGVTIDIKEEEIEVLNNFIEDMNAHLEDDEKAELIKEAGEQTLDGAQTLAYTRTRYVGNDKFDRTERNRVVLQAMMNNIQKMDDVALLGLVDVFANAIESDLSDDQMFALCAEGILLGATEFEMHNIPEELDYTSEMKDKDLYITADLAACASLLNEIIYK